MAPLYEYKVINIQVIRVRKKKIALIRVTDCEDDGGRSKIAVALGINR